MPLRVHPVSGLPADDRAVARDAEAVVNPIELVEDSGRIPCDLIGTTAVVLMLVSSRFVAVLEENRFTGWVTFPVRIHLRDGTEVPGYRGLAVTGRAGPIDDTLSSASYDCPTLRQGRAVRR